MGRTGSLAPTTTSRRNNALGFTLIEILLVLGIIAMVMSLGLPAISRVTLQRLNSTTRQFVGLIRTVRNDAIMLNMVHRIVLDLDRRAYWVEQQTRTQLLAEEEPRDKKKKKDEEEKYVPTQGFSFAEKYSREPRPMPGGVQFIGVFKEKEGLLTEGIVFVHFFPNGFNDYAILHIAKEADPESAYSILVRPTSGKVDIIPEVIKGFEQVR